MPDPLAYLTGMGLAAIASATFALAMAALHRRAHGWQALMTAGLATGVVSGLVWLGIRWQWPPGNGLNRFLFIVLPATAVIELAGSLPRVPTGILWTLRAILSVAIPRILLHGSVYLTAGGLPATDHPAGTALAGSGVLLAAVWWSLGHLAQRPSGASIPPTLVEATVCGGLCILLAGYLKGGAAAFPLAGAVAGATLAAGLITFRTGLPTVPLSLPIVSIGLVGLFGLLLVGCAFGRLTLGRGLVIFLSPLLCWVTELAILRRMSSRACVLVRLILVAIPLLMVLALAKRDFDRNLAPLINSRGSAARNILNVRLPCGWQGNSVARGPLARLDCRHSISIGNTTRPRP